jgi:hypothetical protein
MIEHVTAAALFFCTPVFAADLTVKEALAVLEESADRCKSGRDLSADEVRTAREKYEAARTSLGSMWLHE